ncbi:MAG: hypothetical protein NTX50_13920 [Candidatus Sumerlaeota bacterium]|nr:hypothetical protein [Candidatus Sumerlaeota bacterium]
MPTTATADPPQRFIHNRRAILGWMLPNWLGRFGVFIALIAVAAWHPASTAQANGGPFLIKSPQGDPAAKGVLARLDPDLKPARETRLQVIKEDLDIRFTPDSFMARNPGGPSVPPKVNVTASYLIANPTSEAIQMEFGFPILRGIYMNPYAMVATPDVRIQLDGKENVSPIVISNSGIYGLLRRKAMGAISQTLKDNAELRRLFEDAQTASGEKREPARTALAGYLTRTLKWTEGEAALMQEFAALCPPEASSCAPAPAGAAAKSARPLAPFGAISWDRDASLREAITEANWATAAIGEQKATQWLTLLAGKFDPAGLSAYEEIFKAWGGDVRERSVDLQTGKIRPREFTATTATLGRDYSDSDVTVYARMDYLDANKLFTAEQKASWKATLKNLPVVFTFAPMNILYYRVAFPAGATRTVAVSYSQYAYRDTAMPESYQVAYVLHPASFWDSFGPINLTVTAPEGVAPAAPIPLQLLDAAAPAKSGTEGIALRSSAPMPQMRSYGATLTEKTGEFFIGVKAEDWNNAVKTPKK